MCNNSCSVGAKGIGSFKDRISAGYLPTESSIQHEGLFYDYYFETPKNTKTLFGPSFLFANSPDPLSGKMESFIGIGMSSMLDGEGLYKNGGRPALNLTIVLDVSGSMNSGFSYEDKTSKLDIAKDCVQQLLGVIKPSDRFSLITFDDKAKVVQPLVDFDKLDLKNLRNQVSAIRTDGGTAFDAAIIVPSEQYKEIISKQASGDSAELARENRIIILTDAEPTVGSTDGAVLFRYVNENVKNRLYTTFIGVGLDFNTDIVTAITKAKGCNYFSVKSAKDMQKRFLKDFDYLVTPDSFDAEIHLKQGQPNFSVIRVYGSPGNEIPKVETQLLGMESTFPSPTEEGQTETQNTTMTKGGVVVAAVKLPKDYAGKSIFFVATYKDRLGKVYNDEYKFDLPANLEEVFYQSVSFRKAITLVRYVNFMKQLIIDQEETVAEPTSFQAGIPIPVPPNDSKTSHSRYGSPSVAISPQYTAVLEKFQTYLEAEIQAIDDPQLQRELKQFQKVKEIILANQKNQK